jgi:alkane 1-monooxygenase
MLHSLSLLFPMGVFLWLLAAPHVPLARWGAILAFVLAVALDAVARPERSPPEARLPSQLFDAVLVLASALQLANVALLVQLASHGWTADVGVGVFLVGTASGYTGIVVSHELVHRKGGWFWLGRALLTSVLYDHFATEHVRGHHKRVATEEDPATARYDETLVAFLRRTVTGQLRSALEIEQRRNEGAWLQNTVLHGLIAELALLGTLSAVSPVAALAFALQAAVAILLLESVNYIEHWGLRRAGPRVTWNDSWDAESWFTYYTLVGLSRHADHHAYASRPWQSLRHVAESPKMPAGYWAMVIWAIFHNRSLRARLRRILAERASLSA